LQNSKSETWAATPIGVGTVLTAGWNGAPALYHGATIKPEKANPALQAANGRAFLGSRQWGARGYENIAPGDAIFFDWDLDGVADHVGLVLGRDGSRVYTVEGNSGDACKIKSYDLNYQSIKGYGLMNW